MSSRARFDAYLPEDLRAATATAVAAGLPWVSVSSGSVLFADVSGFTALSERLFEKLGRAGAEQLTSILNAYFERMIAEIATRGGIVQKFGGDAMTVVFHGPAAPQGAVAAAAAMQAAMPEFEAIATPAGPAKLEMKIGIASGEIRLMLLGEAERRIDYVVEGAPVDDAAAAEHHARAGDIVLCPATAATLGATGTLLADGFVRLDGTVVPAPPPAPASAPIPPGSELFFPPALRSRIASGDAILLNEHRHVAIVFASIPRARYDERTVLDKLQRFILQAEAQIETFGGIVSKLDFGDKGSKLLAVFGAPVAVEACEEAATRAALALAAIAKSSVGEAAIGVNAGAVFAGDVGSRTRREYTVMGDAVNLAARLMQKAGFGRILASETVWQRAAGLTWQAIESFAVKGKRQPIQAAVPSGGAGSPPSTAPPTAAAAEGIARPELERSLHDFIDRWAAGAGGALALVAPAGAGKSVLAAGALARIPPSSARVLSHAVRPWESRIPFGWARSTLARLLDLPPEGPTGRLEVRLRMTFADHARLSPADLDLALAAIGIRSPARGSSDDDSKNRIGLVASLLDEVRGDRPTLFVIDGAHELDALSAALLEVLIGRAGTSAYLLLARPPYDTAAPTIELPNLDFAQTGALIALRLGAERVHENLARFVHQRTSGNPLYVDSLIEQLRLAGAARLSVLDQSWVLDDARAASVAADSLEALLLRRIDGLPELERRLVKSASVLGDRFPESLLGDIEGVNDVERTPALADLLQRGILERQQDDLVFPDATMRRAIYTSLPAEARRHLHRRAARILDRDHRRRIDDRAEHWFHAGEPRKAIPLLLRVAESSRRRFLNRLALLQIERLRRAHASLSERDSARFAATLARASILEGHLRLAIGELDAARVAIAPLLSSSAGPQRLPALDLAAQIAMRQSRLDEVLELAATMIAIAEQSADDPWLGSGLLLRAGARARRGEIADASADFQRSIALLEQGQDKARLIRAIMGWGNCLAYGDRPAEALPFLARAVTLARRTRARSLLAAGLINRSVAESRLGRLDRQARSLQETVRLLEASGASSLLLNAYGSLNGLALSRGDFAETIRLSRLHRQCCDHLGATTERLVSLTVLATVAVIRGDAGEIENLTKELLHDRATALAAPALTVPSAVTLVRGLVESRALDLATEVVELAYLAADGREVPQGAALRILRHLQLGEVPPTEDWAEAAASSFLEDRVLAAGLGPERQRNAPVLEALARQGIATGDWLGALEALHLLGSQGPPRVRNRCSRQLTRIANKLGSTLWQTRAAALLDPSTAVSVPLLTALVERHQIGSPPQAVSDVETKRTLK